MILVLKGARVIGSQGPVFTVCRKYPRVDLNDPSYIEML